MHPMLFFIYNFFSTKLSDKMVTFTNLKTRELRLRVRRYYGDPAVTNFIVWQLRPLLPGI